MQLFMTNCEPSVDTFWDNLRNAEQAKSLAHVCMVVESYFHLPGNEAATYADLETAIRAEGTLQLGLIASATNLPGGPPPTSSHGPTKGELQPFALVVSLRPRANVEAETLTHAPSMEENRTNLLHAGSGLDTNLYSPALQDKPFVRLALGKMRLEPVSLQNVFSAAVEKHPTATQAVVAMGKTGGPIIGLFVGNERVCDVGMYIYFDAHNKQVVEFVTLQ
jgi:hypothetical protein